MKKSLARADVIERPDVGLLRLRIGVLVGTELDGFPRPMVARALLAKAFDLSLESTGMTGTTQMADRARDLLGGRWSTETIRAFIEGGCHPL